MILHLIGNVGGPHKCDHTPPHWKHSQVFAIGTIAVAVSGIVLSGVISNETSESLGLISPTYIGLISSALGAIVTGAKWVSYIIKSALPWKILNKDLGDVRHWGWKSENLVSYCDSKLWQIRESNL